MRANATTVGAVLMMLLGVISANAQECTVCSRISTIEGCVKCVRALPEWREKAKGNANLGKPFCNKNQPQCSKQAEAEGTRVLGYEKRK